VTRRPSSVYVISHVTLQRTKGEVDEINMSTKSRVLAAKTCLRNDRGKLRGYVTHCPFLMTLACVAGLIYCDSIPSTPCLKIKKKPGTFSNNSNNLGSISTRFGTQNRHIVST